MPLPALPARPAAPSAELVREISFGYEYATRMMMLGPVLDRTDLDRLHREHAIILTVLDAIEQRHAIAAHLQAPTKTYSLTAARLARGNVAEYFPWRAGT